jgi:hypothetical protein
VTHHCRATNIGQWTPTVNLRCQVAEKVQTALVEIRYVHTPQLLLQDMNTQILNSVTGCVRLTALILTERRLTSGQRQLHSKLHKLYSSLGWLYHGERHGFWKAVTVYIYMSWDSVACIAIGHGLDDRVVRVRVLVGSRFFSSPRRPPSLLSNGYQWGFPQG